MSFIRRLFSFLDNGNEPIPTPQYPSLESYHPKINAGSYLMSLPYNRSVSTQTVQTISNLTTKESETEISVPPNFVPKETSYSFLSSRFQTNQPSRTNRFIFANSSQNSEPEDSKSANNEFSIGSNKSAPRSESPSSDKKQVDNKTESSSDYKSTSDTDTVASYDFKPKDDKIKSEASSGYIFENKADTLVDVKPKVEKKEEDTMTSLTSKPIEDDDENEEDKVYSFVFCPKGAKSDADSQSTQEKKQPEAKNGTENKKEKELDIEKIKALINQRINKKHTFTTQINTNFYNRRSVIQNEKGGFSYYQKPNYRRK